MASNSPRPAASIITVTFNNKHQLAAYIRSVLAGHGNFEVIIADNASTDGSVEFIESEHTNAHIIRNASNLGFARANNHGSRHARADILVFLNPDTAVEPDWLIQLLKPFADPQVGLATSKVVLMQDPEKLNTCGNDVHISGITLCRGMGQSHECYADDDDVTAVSGAAFAIRRELYEQIGGFNEHFFIYMEDTALSLEARLRGWRCAYAAGSRVRHDYELRFGPRKVFYQERNRYMMLLQLYRWPTLVILLPTLLLAEVVTWGFVLTRDRANWMNKWKAYVDIVKHWPVIMAKRRLNQAQRQVRDRTLLATTTHALEFGQVSQGVVERIAAAVFNPLFWLLRHLALVLVRW